MDLTIERCAIPSLFVEQTARYHVSHPCIDITDNMQCAKRHIFSGLVQSRKNDGGSNDNGRKTPEGTSFAVAFAAGEDKGAVYCLIDAARAQRGGDGSFITSVV
ncbi:hypothetical protein EVAR_68145_1 [Eumeta japonica]|uniref:Uncharacterized protein n=1 Tax=Eumeta variegata TaxID=151549 RepID=A0A4C2A3C8_EUMVA|nr:hypothetical protein EVAR_68145_1 [Eumeta japonica]